MTESARRIIVPARLMARLDDFAEEVGLDAADIQELALAMCLPSRGDSHAAVEAQKSSDLLGRLIRGDGVELGAVRDELRGVSVAMLRMGAPRSAVAARSGVSEDLPNVSLADLPLEDTSPGYPRFTVGMSLADAPETIWASAAGYWRMKTVRYIAPSRFGMVPYVFTVDSWAKTARDRVWAAEGSLIDTESGLLKSIHGDDERRGRFQFGAVTDATKLDLRVARTLIAAPIRLGRRGTNPVIPL